MVNQKDNNGRNWPSAALLILNWNGKDLLEQYLPSFLDLDYPDYQVVIIDNGSIDGSVAYVRDHFPQFDVIAHKRNLGFTRGYNAALEQIESDVLILLNNDISVRTDWLKALIRPMIDDPTIGITGGKLLYPDGKTLQHAGANLSYPLAFSQHDFYKEIDAGQADEQKEVPYVTGAAMAINRAVVTEIGLLDEAFVPIYYEEVDFCYRARAAGFRVMYAPDAVAIHHESFTMNQMSSWHIYAQQKNRLRFVLRHYSPAQFVDEYVPAELMRLQNPMSPAEVYQLRRALLTIKLILPEILLENGIFDKRQLYETALERLRQAVLAKRPHISQAPPTSEVENRLAENQVVTEPDFHSEVPIIGPLIAAFRRSWNDIATKWYVRSIIQQQMTFNRLVTKLIGEQDRQGEAIMEEVNVLADELLRVKQQLAQMEARRQVEDKDRQVD